MFTVLSQGLSFLYWVIDSKGGTHFIISFLFSLRVEQPTHWTGSTVITGEKETLHALTIGHIIDPRVKGRLSETESLPTDRV